MPKPVVQLPKPVHEKAIQLLADTYIDMGATPDVARAKAWALIKAIRALEDAAGRKGRCK